MLPTVFVTLLALTASLALAASGLGVPAAVAHLAFAVGILPLILAAMSHFVPVLTRTGDPERMIRLVPHAAQGAGLVAVAAMQGILPFWALHAAAVADLLLALLLSYWIAGRAARTLGSPHPGWRWYGAALACLVLALLATLATAAVPAQWPVLRNFHLHLNTLGLVGLAALGTLPVLLPTVLGGPDPDAAAWLRRHLWPVAGGVLVVATGAAWSSPIAIAGATVLLVVVLGLVAQWVRRYGLLTLAGDGISASLLAAAVGLMVALLAGIVHGAGLLPARPTLAAWTAGFLLPLVSGALSQLLPVWRWPGPAIPARTAMRSRLAAGGRGRAVLFLCAALAFLGGEAQVGIAFVLAALLLFAIALTSALRVSRSTR